MEGLHKGKSGQGNPIARQLPVHIPISPSPMRRGAPCAHLVELPHGDVSL